MNPIQPTVTALKLSEQKNYRNLTVFPLRHAAPREPGYLTLDQALAGGAIRIRELSEAGSVPQLRVENRSDKPVLLLDGEELVGAKQNRVLNLTILIPARKTMKIPVSCVESGRWRYRSPDFTPSGDAHFYRGRAGRAASVSRSLREMGHRQSDQGQVWRDIDVKMMSMEVGSPTAAMACMYSENRGRLEDYLDNLLSDPDHMGAVFAIGDRIAGVEFFDAPATFAEFYPKIVGSYAVDAMEIADKEAAAPHEREARGFLNQIAETELERYPALGLGEDVRVSGTDLSGGGLVLDDQVIHFAAFVR
jgi:hypothetical protein